MTLIPFSHRIGFVTVAGPTRSRRTGRFVAAIAPAKPAPTGTRTPCRTSSSIPQAAARHQLIGALVEEEDRRRIGVDDLSHPAQQLHQQILDPEMA